MRNSDAADVDRAAIKRTRAELLAAVNASDADRCSAVWAANGVLMPPHHPAVPGHQAIVQYFRTLFRGANSDSCSLHPRSTLSVIPRWSASRTQPSSGPETTLRRLKTSAKAYTCTSVSQTGRGSSRTTSGTAINLRLLEESPHDGDPFHQRTDQVAQERR